MRRVVALVLAGCVLTATVFVNKIDKLSTKVVAAVVEHTLNFDENTVMYVGGEKVEQEYYNLIYSSFFNQAYQYYCYYMGAGEDWLEQKVEGQDYTVGEDIKRATAEYITEEIVACNKAAGYGIVFDEELKNQVDAVKQRTIANCGGDEAYAAALKEIRTSDEAYTKSLEHSAVYKKYIDEMYKEGGVAYVTDDEVINTFSEKYMKVQHILISTLEQQDDEGNLIPARTEEEAVAVVNEVLGKLKAGEDFDSLIDIYGEDPGITSGNYYIFTDGQMVAEFEEASKNLKVGEYTKQAVKTDYGYHIIKKYEIEAEGAEFESFKATYAEDKLVGIIGEYVDAAFVVINDEVLNPYIDAWNKELQGV